MKQEYTSEKTSISTVNAVYTQGYFKKGDEILDYGGGKYNKNIEYLNSQGVKCFVYDPFNRTEQHNKRVLDYFIKKNGAEIIVCSNVLCVIKEDEVIYDVLNKIRTLLKKKVGSKIYIVVYHGDKSGLGGPTSRGYQRNQNPIEYTKFINDVFGDIADIKRKVNIFEITLNGGGLYD